MIALREKKPYILKDGTEASSVTQVLKVLNKPALIKWAWKLGKEGKDCDEERDRAAHLGQLAHEIVRNKLRPDPGKIFFPSPDFDTALERSGSFIHWLANHGTWVDLKVEEPIISEELRLGGTPDVILTRPDGTREIIDFKTGNGIYPEMFLQLGGYALLAGRWDPAPSGLIVRCGEKEIEVTGLTPQEMREQAAAFMALLLFHKLWVKP